MKNFQKNELRKRAKLGHTCLQKKQKNSSPTKTGKVSFARPDPEYEHDKIPSCLARKISRFDPQ